ncbi:uncharacterized protein L969DRAFT_46769 [Mixia osmundae IAM 14324]|uniref:Uncharacterized protein n=1 Tax=Mixia osmundae (strain CBS 9802 / IAM 14324 / JCM 22182 / KY 12970) TaxID=764103 RepID=G7E5Q0_MIXOS|nr:uncharacterized protein L969DRAFT_46769 [Mixia osmundae IAM 14324]KEI40690.1 hypothetical protein L969DRAFT_46769 [Mixia osmundae IAM 14324]GAA98160.1 hypothetical protein E5Q_04843 [Mixia osmundae IAM 14324]
MAGTTVTSHGIVLLDGQIYPFEVKSMSPQQLFLLKIQLPKKKQAYCHVFGDAPKGPNCEPEKLELVSGYQTLQVNAVRALDTLGVLSANENVNRIIRQCCSAVYSFTARAWLGTRKLELGEAFYTFVCGPGTRFLSDVPVRCRDLFEEVLETTSTVEIRDARLPIWTSGQHQGWTSLGGPKPAVTANYCLLLQGTTVTSQGILAFDGQPYAFEVKSWSPMVLFTMRAQLPEGLKTYCFADKRLPKGPRCEEQERKAFPDYTVMQINAVRRLETVHIETESEMVHRVISFCCSAFWSFTASARVPGYNLRVGEAVYTLTCGGEKSPIPGLGTTCSAIFNKAFEMKSDTEDKPGLAVARHNPALSAETASLYTNAAASRSCFIIVSANYCLLLEGTTVMSNGVVELDGQPYAFEIKSYSPTQLFTMRAQLPDHLKSYCYAAKQMPKGPRCEEQARRAIPDYVVMQMNAVRRLETLHVDSDSDIVNQVIGFCCSAFVSFTAKAWIPRYTIDIGEAVYTLTCSGGMRPIPGLGASCSAIFEKAIETKSNIEDKPGVERAIWTMDSGSGCTFIPSPPIQVAGASGTA